MCVSALHSYAYGILTEPAPLICKSRKSKTRHANLPMPNGGNGSTRKRRRSALQINYAPAPAQHGLQKMESEALIALLMSNSAEHEIRDQSSSFGFKLQFSLCFCHGLVQSEVARRCWPMDALIREANKHEVCDWETKGSGNQKIFLHSKVAQGLVQAPAQVSSRFLSCIRRV